MNILKKGSLGYEVKLLLQCLNLELDGFFGEVTDETVKHFQNVHSLAPNGIVDMATWNKLTPKYHRRTINDIIIHCTFTPEGLDYTVNDIREYHKNAGWADIGYHYVIDLNGKLLKGRDENIVGAHCKNHNATSIGIVYVGGAEKDGITPKDTRTLKQKETLYKLVKKLITFYDLTLEDVHFHNYYTNNKKCPSFLYTDFIKEYQDYFK